MPLATNDQARDRRSSAPRGMAQAQPGRRTGMPTVFLVPSGSDSAEGASSGDYLLRRTGDDLYEVGKLGDSCTWLGTLSASLLPSLPEVDAGQEAPEQEALLAAVQGVESAQDNRGG